MKNQHIHFLCDLDGVIYRGEELIHGAQAFLAKAKQCNRKVLFLTNSATKTPAMYADKLARLGVTGSTPDQFFTAALATADFLKTFSRRRTAFVVGEVGLISALEAVGIALTQDSPEFVVVGHTNHFNFETLKIASKLIRNGSKFIGTNPDLVDPVEDGFEPGCGSLLASIEAASGISPYVIGKPNTYMMRLAQKKIGCPAENIVMIGDRMNTDIKGAMEAGMRTVLALSGATSRQDLSAYAFQPEVIVNHIGEIEFE